MLVVCPSRENVIFVEWQKLRRANAEAWTQERQDAQDIVERIAESVYQYPHIVGRMIMMDDTMLMEEEQEQCPHDEHDHGICLDCEKDITDDLVGKAESAYEGDR